MSLLPGIGSVLAGGGGASETFTGVVTVGFVTLEIPKSPITVYGYSDGDEAFGAMGSLAPTTWHGFTIKAIYWNDADSKTYLFVSGNASSIAAVLIAAGADQGLGAGGYSGGVTEFVTTTTVANPFPTPAASVAVAISG